MMKHCAITGAADGIGKALAFAFGRAGYVITGIDRDAALAGRTGDELASAGIKATFIAADLAVADDLDLVAARLRDGPPINVMIHNAGINAVGHFGRIDMHDQHAVLGVNLVAPLLLTAALLRDDLVAPGASLVFMSSLSRFVGYPGAAVYAATKDGLASYARGLAVARPDLHVVTVYPGPTRTAHARRYSPDNRREARRMPPERVAAHIFAAVRDRRRTVIPGRGNQLFAVVGRLVPSLTTWLMRKTLLEKLP